MEKIKLVIVRIRFAILLVALVVIPYFFFFLYQESNQQYQDLIDNPPVLPVESRKDDSAICPSGTVKYFSHCSCSYECFREDVVISDCEKICDNEFEK